MIAQVVPVIRLRRDTAWWSYRIPDKTACSAGSLVEISFQGRRCLGVVWKLDPDDAHASKEIDRVICHTPLLKAAHRQLIEWLSEQGLCSLSSALYCWMPSFLRALPLKNAARKALESHDAWNAYPPAQPAEQTCYALPSVREETLRYLKNRHGGRAAVLFGGSPEREEVARWFSIARGETTVGIGREGALFAPWLNLRRITVIDPEDIAYYHEQSPYLDLLDGWRVLGEAFRAELRYRTHLPQSAAELLWPGKAAGSQLGPLRPLLIDLNHEPLLGPRLVDAVKDCLGAGLQCRLLYNRHDYDVRIRREGREERLTIPGMETIGKQLARKLGQEELPASVLIGGRRILRQTGKVGLQAVLSLDYLENRTVFADQLQGIADFALLSTVDAPLIIQTHGIEHPLVTALCSGQLETYARHLVEEQHSLHLPPFGQHIVCSYPESDEGAVQAAEALYAKLARNGTDLWQISHPFASRWRRKPYYHVLLHSSSSLTRLPTSIRTVLAALERPWKVQRDPWYLL